MKKRGQNSIGISFGMIFSIIIIIAIVGVGFFGITYFINLGKCDQIRAFKELFDQGINSAYQGDKVRGIFPDENTVVTLPSGIEHVCFGTFETNPRNAADRELKRTLQLDHVVSNDNVFFTPLRKACDGNLGSFTLKKANITTFFCKEVIDGKISVHLQKDRTQGLVTISP